MSADIHPTAIVSRNAELGAGVKVGPFAIIGDGCVVADNCTIAPHAVLERNVQLADGVRVGVGSVLGGDPQDLKFKGEQTTVEIGEGSVIREYSTINRGTAQSMKTTVGRGCFIMSYVHLAHDCHIGDGVIISNATQLAGHVTVEEKAILSGVSAVHQFALIGKYSFIGGSMGSVVGEKITRAIERALQNSSALIVVSCSGGARMQEGALSLMQMAKISSALARLDRKRLPYISVLTDPTTGGVTASYAMLGDLNVAEPGALIGFAGPRVIEQTIRQKLPEGFQRSEFLLKHGMIDAIVHRKDMKTFIANSLTFFMS